MADTTPFKRLILRAVLRHVSPMVIRLISVSDHLPIDEFHDVFRAILGWTGDLGYIIRVHGQEFTASGGSRDPKHCTSLNDIARRKFLYICDTRHMWEWDVRVLDIPEGIEGDHASVCVGGRGAAPPEFCGGPTGYRLMLKRQREGAAMSDRARLEAGIQMLAQACPDEPVDRWDLLRTLWGEAFQSIDQRLKDLDPLQPECFNLQEANARVQERVERRR